MEYLGTPPANLLEKSRRKNKFFNENNEPILYKTSRGKVRRPNTKKLEKFLGIKDEKLINFIEVNSI
jgi:dual specificity tyrosine-phosphorylation-regulated kinase 2/3/4